MDGSSLVIFDGPAWLAGHCAPSPHPHGSPASTSRTVTTDSHILAVATACHANSLKSMT
jgi:hypothetical protein